MVIDAEADYLNAMFNERTRVLENKIIDDMMKLHGVKMYDRARWENKYGMIESDPQPTSIGDNGIVNKAEVIAMGRNRYIIEDRKDPFPKHQVDQMIRAHAISGKPGRYLQKPWDIDSKDKASWDNEDTIVALSVSYGLDHHKIINLVKWVHPRSWCFQAGFKYKILSPFLVITGLLQIWTCLFTRYKNTDRGRVPATDGQRIIHIRTHFTRDKSKTMKLFGKICYWILERKARKNWAGNWRLFLTSEYFWKHRDHPARILSAKF